MTIKETLTSLKDLSSIMEQAGKPMAESVPQVTVSEPAQRDSKGRVYATGKRKRDAVARVFLKELDKETSTFCINDKTLEEYFPETSFAQRVLEPLKGLTKQYHIWATVKGGGKSGQAGALRHGIAQALAKWDPTLRTSLKAKELLVRDSRIVERKKPGQPKARKNFQFSKR